MGKRSRERKKRKEKREKALKRSSEFFSLKIIRFGVYFALFSPLIVNANFYFPFVGPKSLYFMGICQIIFFAWLFLIINQRKYRPRLNSILIALTLFLIVLTITSILGVDFSRSFWSKPERMTGLLMWLHLFAFFLVVSSVFQSFSDWEKIFIVSVSVATLISILALFEVGGIKIFRLSGRGGATLGNTSFLGTYLLFNAFFALWLFFQKRTKKISFLFLTSLALMILAIYFQGARAAFLSFFGGATLLFLFWLSFQPKIPKLRIFGKTLLFIFAISVLILLTLIFIPGNFVHQKFIEVTRRARFINWEMAQKAFLERPILGWGLENYTIVFPKFFNPCFFLPECGGEIWFDRSHNIIFDTLVTSGIIGLISYLALFVSFFYILGKSYFKEKTISFWTFGIFSTLVISYFVQNLTVFDMPTSLMLFLLVLGFGAFLKNLKREEILEKRIPSKRYYLKIFLILIFAFTFFEFVFQPARADYLVIKALKADNSQKRVALYEKTLKTSALGKYQIREFFAQQSQEILQKGGKKIPRGDVEKELNFLIAQLEKTKKESPLDFRTVLRLGHLYNLYSLLDSQKLSLAEKALKEAIELSPKNQQGYWALAQTKIYQKDFKEAIKLTEEAINLEPKLFQSHEIAIKIAKFSGDLEKAKELFEKAIEVNPQWREKLNKILMNS